ncbi:glycosyltransferase [Aliarcobacter butzleri]|uniref:glycosyltransferase n=1 Tax=Aliarcobacter butzleri TaxID=28197 RepID=UPI00125F1FE0|nr:glycosyltransferase [Aliarcobacter butzleri]MCG3706262.1 glycosyltransferase [Aliarcobacter butzleri]MCT7586157.1 glycosyltransferase [Aliarcobacter butzleri]MDK2065205.1 glycosyltransferase [Aliarcobacter butzleri]MDK2090169.1 glycosyltransferase [Aliarcobacter butzleri]MDN5093272.1 glycosyltransferase [Aliarcobacter butzleri]
MKQKTAIICLSRVNGGMELASVKLARLLSQDVEVEFIARDNSYIANRKEHFESYDINLHIVKFSSNFSFKLISDVREILKNSNIKNIIFLGASEMKSLYFATLGLDINFIIRQGSKKTTSKKDIFHKLFYSNVNYFVGNCEYMKKNIIEILPIPQKASVKRIYSSLKLEENIDFKPLNNHIDLVHVGRVHKGKGQFEAIKACEILEENNISFTIKFLGDIQDKDYLETMKNYLTNSSLKDNVEFVGYTSNVKEYLQKSDIFIFPSLGEGMSNAIIESLGFGLIPIIYDDTSSSEFKDLGFHIHLTKENNIKNLQEILLNVVNNFEEEKAKAKDNHQKALNIFAPQREKIEYLNLLI